MIDTVITEAAGNPWEWGWGAVGSIGSGVAAVVAVAVAWASSRQVRRVSQESAKADARRQREAARRVVVWQGDDDSTLGGPVPVQLANHGTDPVTDVHLFHQPSVALDAEGYPSSFPASELGSWPVLAPGQTVESSRPRRPERALGGGVVYAKFVDTQGREWRRGDNGGITRGKLRVDYDEWPDQFREQTRIERIRYRLQRKMRLLQKRSRPAHHEDATT